MSGILGFGTPAEHVALCRQRALAELEPGGAGWAAALTSIQMDLPKHPACTNHDAIMLSATLTLAGLLCDERTVREFIEGVS